MADPEPVAGSGAHELVAPFVTTTVVATVLLSAWFKKERIGKVFTKTKAWYIRHRIAEVMWKCWLTMIIIAIINSVPPAVVAKMTMNENCAYLGYEEEAQVRSAIWWILVLPASFAIKYVWLPKPKGKRVVDNTRE